LMAYGELESYHEIANKKLPSVVPGVDVYRIDTWAEGRNILADSGWCVRDYEHFQDYEPPFYVFVSVRNGRPKRLALLNMHSGELKDVYNNDLSMDIAERIAPILDEIIVKFPQFPHVSTDLLAALAPIIHLLPQTIAKLKPYQLAEMAGLVWPGGSKQPADRWPEYIEKTLRDDPKSYVAYVQAVTGGTRTQEPHRNKDFERQLIEMAFTIFEEDFEFVVNLLEYFGERIHDFNGDWPKLRELLAIIKKSDLDNEFFRYLRHASTFGKLGFRTLAGREWSVT